MYKRGKKDNNKDRRGKRDRDTDRDREFEDSHGSSKRRHISGPRSRNDHADEQDNKYKHHDSSEKQPKKNEFESFKEFIDQNKPKNEKINNPEADAQNSLNTPKNPEISALNGNQKPDPESLEKWLEKKKKEEEAHVTFLPKSERKRLKKEGILEKPTQKPNYSDEKINPLSSIQASARRSGMSEFPINRSDSSSHFVPDENNPQDGDAVFSNKEIEALKAQKFKTDYEILQARKTRAYQKSGTDKVVFKFDWDADEDTSEKINPIYSNKHEANLLFGRGVRAGVDLYEQYSQSAPFFEAIAVDNKKITKDVERENKQEEEKMKIDQENNENNGIFALKKKKKNNFLDFEDEEAKKPKKVESIQHVVPNIGKDKKEDQKEQEKTEAQRETEIQEAIRKKKRLEQAAKERFSDISWKKKKLEEMSSRDWRILKEDFEIITKAYTQFMNTMNPSSLAQNNAKQQALMNNPLLNKPASSTEPQQTPQTTGSNKVKVPPPLRYWEEAQTSAFSTLISPFMLFEEAEDCLRKAIEIFGTGENKALLSQPKKTATKKKILKNDADEDDDDDLAAALKEKEKEKSPFREEMKKLLLKNDEILNFTLPESIIHTIMFQLKFEHPTPIQRQCVTAAFARNFPEKILMDFFSALLIRYDTWSKSNSSNRMNILSKYGEIFESLIFSTLQPAFDVIGLAKTGTGKTLAFILPMLKYILSECPYMDTPSDGPFALILAPTRELATQICSDINAFLKGGKLRYPMRKQKIINKLDEQSKSSIDEDVMDESKTLPVRVHTIIGGEAVEEQQINLSRGVEIIVATPGRLLDCLDSHYIALSQCYFLVLDEADRMIEMGFEDQVSQILKMMPPSVISQTISKESADVVTKCLENLQNSINLTPETKEIEALDQFLKESSQLPDLKDSTFTSKTRRRQTLMFSATMPPEVEKLANNYLHKEQSVVVSIGDVSEVINTIEQVVVFAAKPNDKRKTVMDILSDPRPYAKLFSSHSELTMTDEEIEHSLKAIVFMRQKRNVDTLVRYLNQNHYNAIALHGSKSQDARKSALKSFKEAKGAILVATDMAARGLDVPDVKLVINYEMPKSIQEYIHRIGRTGRAGRKGVAISVLCDQISDDTALFYDLKLMLLKCNQKIPPQLMSHEAAMTRSAAQKMQTSKDSSSNQQHGDDGGAPNDLELDF